MSFTLTITDWANGAPIPARFAFGRLDANGQFALSDNTSPALRWSGAPEGTRSFALICHDPDVPSSGEDVNQAGRIVPADLPRIEFFHWVLFDIPASLDHIAEGEASQGVTPGGKPCGPTAHGTTGPNNYTQWFDGDADMGGTYGGYDGPCPPWNDSIVHHYHFTLYALSVERLDLTGAATGPEVRARMAEHILATASHMGTYSLNPDVKA